MARRRARPEDPVQLEIPHFSGGLVMAIDPDHVQPTQAVRMANMVFDSELGQAVVRSGMRLADTPAALVLSMHVFYRANAPDQLIRHLASGAVQYTTDITSTTQTWTNIWTGLSTTQPFSYATFNGKVYMTNGVDDYRWWDGSSAGTSASAPKGKDIVVWRDTIWVSVGVSGQPDRVYSSAAGDAETFPALNFVDIAKGVDEGVVALAADPNSLVIFKPRSTYAIYDPVEFSNRPVDQQKGCSIRHSIVYHSGNLYFWSMEGICRYLGDAPNQVVSEPLRPIWDNFLARESVVDTFFAYNFANRVGWTFSDDAGIGRLQIEFYPDLPEQPWVMHTMDLRCIVNYQPVTSLEYLLGSSNSSAKIWQIHRDIEGDDDGDNYEAIYRTPWFDFGRPFNSKYIRKIRLRTRGVYSLKLYIDGEEDSAAKTLTVNGTTGGDREKDVEIFPDLYCRRLALEFTDDDQGTYNIDFPLGDVDNPVVTRGRWSIGRAFIEAVPMGEYR